MRNFLKVLSVALLAVAFVFSVGITKSSDSSKYAWLGVNGQTVNDDLADAFDLGVEHGAIVNQVLRKSPAYDAGMEEGDIIIDFDGQEIYGWDDLVDVLESHNPGDAVSMRVMRGDDELEFKVTLEGKPRHYSYKRRYHTYHDDDLSNLYVPAIPRLPAIPKLPAMPSLPAIPAIPNLSDHYYFDASFDGVYIGVSLSDLSDQLGEYFGVKRGRGALVTDVQKDSPAEKAGIKAGDVIIVADNEEIFDSKDVSEIVGDMEEGDMLAITVLRNKSEQTFEVEVEEYDDYDGNHFRWVAPDIDIDIPLVKGLHHGVYMNELEDYFDSEDFDDLREELEEYEEEMEELREELEDMRLNHREELRDDLDDLRDELEDFKDRLD